MEYKEKIMQLINRIESEEALSKIYEVAKKAAHRRGPMRCADDPIDDEEARMRGKRYGKHEH